jgi:hypothetical protein
MFPEPARIPESREGAPDRGHKLRSRPLRRRHRRGTVPEVALAARAVAQFAARAVAHVAFTGITQFIDVGTGLPAAPAVGASRGGLPPGQLASSKSQMDTAGRPVKAARLAPGTIFAAGVTTAGSVSGGSARSG